MTHDASSAERNRDASLYKSSIQSFSQSNEADDERTPSEVSSSMGPDSSTVRAAPDMPLYVYPSYVRVHDADYKLLATRARTPV
jgi:hypothetical protein